jgi:hypothetical protein
VCGVSSECDREASIMRQLWHNRECHGKKLKKRHNGPCNPCLLVITDVSNDYVSAIFRVVSWTALKMAAEAPPRSR